MKEETVKLDFEEEKIENPFHENHCMPFYRQKELEKIIKILHSKIFSIIGPEGSGKTKIINNIFQIISSLRRTITRNYN